MICKHNWIEPAWAVMFKVRRVDVGFEYFYTCTRCSEARIVTLLPKESPALRAGLEKGET